MMRCNLCETAMAQMYCDTCLDNLCKACVGYHILTDQSKGHKVFKYPHPRCTSHDEERCEMYCNQCHIPVCIICQTSKSHSGHELSKIMQALKEKKEKIATEKKELKETIYPTYLGIASDVKNRIGQLEKKCGDLSTAIAKHGEDWHSDELVQKLKAEVDVIKNTQLRMLQKHLDEVNKKISEINDEMNAMDVALDSNDMLEVFTFMPKADEYRNLPKLPKFTPEIIEEELCKLFGTLSISVRLEEHGYSIKTTSKSPEATPSPVIEDLPDGAQAAISPVIKQLLDEPQTIYNIPTQYSNMYNAACLSDGKIWTCGNSNTTATMKLYSIGQGSPLKSIKTTSGKTPEDITVTNSGDLVYTDYGDRTVNIVQNEEIQTVIRLQGWRPRGVCSTTSGDLLLIMESDEKKDNSKVVRYSNFKETQTIRFDEEGCPLYSSGDNYRYISENRNQDICVAESGAKAVVVVNLAGNLRFRYTGHTPAPKNKPFIPKGLATDSQSHMLVADYNNYCVHIIDQDGQFLRFIERELIYPWGLCIDTQDNLYVAQWKSKQVKKIKYLQ